MIELKKLENVSAIAIVVAFFLPWVNLGFISFSGHDLPNLWDAVNSLSNAFSETENVSAGVNYYLVVYLVPILALVFLLLEYLGKPSKNFAICNKRYKYSRFSIYSDIQIRGRVGHLWSWYLDNGTCLFVNAAMLTGRGEIRQ